MARVRQGAGNVPGAVEALDLIPQTSRAYTPARTRRGRLLAGSGQGLSALGEALDSVKNLQIDLVEKAQLTVDVMENALAWVTSPQGGAQPGFVLNGHPAHEKGVRTGLEAAYRQLAQVTIDQAERVALVDRANAVRPWSMW